MVSRPLLFFLLQRVMANLMPETDQKALKKRKTLSERHGQKRNGQAN